MYIPALQDISWILPYRTELLTDYFKLYLVFGQPAAYIFILASWFWYNSSKLPVFLAFTACFATLLSNLIKLSFAIPRPPVEYFLINAPSFGFPSGDVQLVTTFWIILAMHFRSKPLYAFCIFLIPNVMLSRIYLGVHNQLDVSAGMIVGVLSALFLNSQFFTKIFDHWWSGKKLSFFWGVFLISFATVIAAFPETINTPISIAFGSFFGLGIAFSRGIQFGNAETRSSIYMLSAIITLLAILYIFIPGTLISGQYKWVNITIKFSILSLYIYYLVPKCLRVIQQDEELRDV